MTTSLTELAREQGLLGRPVPDYVALVTAVFPTEKGAEDFRAYLRKRRAGGQP